MQKNRRGDLWSDLRKKLYEFKSGAEISQSQLDDLLLVAAALDIDQLDILFGRTPTKKTRERIERKLRELRLPPVRPTTGSPLRRNRPVRPTLTPVRPARSAPAGRHPRKEPATN